jgi:hypothetical protein
MDNSLMACSIALSRVRQEVNLGAVRLEGFPDDVSMARRLLREEPVSFGLWGTSLLAAMPDRQVSNGSVATGAGRVRGKRGTFEVLTWVPLRSRVARCLPTSRHQRLSKVGFVLRHGGTHSQLADWIHQRLNVAVHEVTLESLVDARSREQGVAAEVATVASPAR